MKTSINDLNLQSMAFSKRFNRLMLAERIEAVEPRGMYITVSRDDPSGIRYNLISFVPTVDGEPADYTYTATPWNVVIHTKAGDMELCYDTIPEVLRFRTKNGIGAQFFVNFSVHEMFVDRLDGSLEVGFTKMGQFLFDVTTGKQTHDNQWIGPRMCATPTTIKWEPENGVLEGYVHWNTEYVIKQQVNDFDECVEANRKDYEFWLSQFPELSEKYKDVRELAGYVFWISYQRELMSLKEPIMYMMRCGIIQRGTAWQQCDHAMACWRNQDFVFDIIHSFFSMQDEYGMIPDCMNDRSVEYTATKPPFQGFALTWILDHLGDENVDPKKAEKIYEPICRWVDWWRNFRDDDHDGLYSYNHGDESGLDDASIFAAGVPVDSPDLQAYLALTMEACGRLAKILGRNEEAEKHFADSRELINKMIDVLWNGDKFVCYLEKEKRFFSSYSMCSYIPIILGKRLPQEIIDKLAADIGDPRKFYDDFGFAGESKDSPLYENRLGAFALGMPMAVTQLVFTVGLYWAGKTELAAKNAENWCDLSIDYGGPITDYTGNCVKDDDPNRNVVFSTAKQYPGGYVSWGTPVFFVLGEILNELTEKGE